MYVNEQFICIKNSYNKNTKYVALRLILAHMLRYSSHACMKLPVIIMP